jgi:hypothetical protein
MPGIAASPGLALIEKGEQQERLALLESLQF